MKLAGVSTEKLVPLAVLVRVSCGRFTVVFVVAVLLPVQVTGEPEHCGSLTPVGGITVALCVRLAAALDATVQAIVSVDVPPLPTMATPLQVPVPDEPGTIVPTLKVPPEGV